MKRPSNQLPRRPVSKESRFSGSAVVGPENCDAVALKVPGFQPRVYFQKAWVSCRKR